jgi:glutamine amidotransferase-like uncharacterized protein
LSKKIAVYCDDGVRPGCFQQVLTAFEGYPIEAVDRHFFLSKDWETKTSLVVFPGGRDLPYLQALQGEANGRIRSYVENGGRFLGLCAGGYYGCLRVNFRATHEEEVVGERELAFFSGNAVGPAFYKDSFRYQSEEGARSVAVQWEKGISHVYFNGGCFFERVEDDPTAEVLARYIDLPSRPAAIIYCRKGEGSAVLSGVHPEFAPKDPFWQYLINKILI